MNESLILAAMTFNLKHRMPLNEIFKYLNHDNLYI